MRPSTRPSLALRALPRPGPPRFSFGRACPPPPVVLDRVALLAGPPIASRAALSAVCAPGEAQRLSRWHAAIAAARLASLPREAFTPSLRTDTLRMAGQGMAGNASAGGWVRRVVGLDVNYDGMVQSNELRRLERIDVDRGAPYGAARLAALRSAAQLLGQGERRDAQGQLRPQQSYEELLLLLRPLMLLGMAAPRGLDPLPDAPAGAPLPPLPPPPRDHPDLVGGVDLRGMVVGEVWTGSKAVWHGRYRPREPVLSALMVSRTALPSRP